MKIDKEISSIDMAEVLWIWLMPFALAIAAVMGEIMDGNALNFWKVTSIIVFSYIVWFTIIFGLGGLGWFSERMKGTKQTEKKLAECVEAHEKALDDLCKKSREPYLCDGPEKSVQKESDEPVHAKVIPPEPKSDLWKPNEAKRAYEPWVAPRPSMGSQLNALKDVQVTQVQTLENIQNLLRKLLDEFKSAGGQNMDSLSNLYWELQALREHDADIEVTKLENGKFRHWRETRRYH